MLIKKIIVPNKIYNPLRLDNRMATNDEGQWMNIIQRTCSNYSLGKAPIAGGPECLNYSPLFNRSQENLSCGEGCKNYEDGMVSAIDIILGSLLNDEEIKIPKGSIDLERDLDFTMEKVIADLLSD